MLIRGAIHGSASSIIPPSGSSYGGSVQRLTDNKCARHHHGCVLLGSPGAHFPRDAPWIGSFIVLCALLSPAILFGLERGNVDTILFSLLAFGLFATRGLSGPWKFMTRGGLIIALTVLKAYPIAACAALANHRRCLVAGRPAYGRLGIPCVRWDVLGSDTLDLRQHALHVLLLLRRWGPLSRFSCMGGHGDRESDGAEGLSECGRPADGRRGGSLASLKPSGFLRRFLPPLTDATSPMTSAWQGSASSA